MNRCRNCKYLIKYKGHVKTISERPIKKYWCTQWNAFVSDIDRDNKCSFKKEKKDDE